MENTAKPALKKIDPATVPGLPELEDEIEDYMKSHPLGLVHKNTRDSWKAKLTKFLADAGISRNEQQGATVAAGAARARVAARREI